MFIAVALGAFAAHALKNKISTDLLLVFETGVRYQVYHALGLFVVGFLSEKNLSPLMAWAGGSFTVGILVFSGSLYILSLTGVRWWGAITPLGGVAFLLGWAFLLFGAKG